MSTSEINLSEITIGSRESPLALAQTHYVRDQLHLRYPELTIHIQTFKTKGDLFLDAALSAVGDKGLFVKELEDALLKGSIDLAVHSLKDMLSLLPEGLAMSSMGPRENPADAWIQTNNLSFWALPAGSVVGTASLRRVAQIKRLRPDLQTEVVRGNLQTRLRKLDAGEYDALILAAAGLHRMGLSDRITSIFGTTDFIPAVGQGILALEFRGQDQTLKAALADLIESDVETAMHAERSFLKTLEGGCQVPMGAYAYRQDSDTFTMTGIVLSPDGQQALSSSRAFKPTEAVITGEHLARDLIAQGADRLLKGEP